MKTEAIEGIIARYEEDVERWACLLQISPSERNDAAAARAELAALKAENAWLRSLAIHSEAATKERCAEIARAQAWSHAYTGMENGPELNSQAICDAILALPSAYEEEG